MPGSFARTLEAIHWANEFGLPIQVNTSISKRNMHDLENMANLLKQFKLVLWSAFFLVPTGRAQMADLLSADEVEQTFATLYRFSKELPFKVKTTEAQTLSPLHRPATAQEQRAKVRSPARDDGWEKTIPGLSTHQ